MKNTKSYLSQSQKKVLGEVVREVPEQVKSSFEKAFAAWKETWFHGPLSISSDPSDRAGGKEYHDLIALGSPAIPLVLQKLADPENFMALQLYDALQTDVNLLVHIEPDDDRILEGEQGRARRTVQAWIANRWRYGNQGRRRCMARKGGGNKMKTVPLSEVKNDLSKFLRLAETEQIVITRHGKPAGVLIGFGSDDDWFEYRLVNDPRFLRRIETARQGLRKGKGIRLEEVEDIS
jgi:prevent-host-death family protein